MTEDRNGGAGRDERGRFLPGNRAAAGHGPWKHRQALATAVTEDHIAAAGLKLHELGMDGDVSALVALIKLLVAAPKPLPEAEEASDVDEMSDYL